MNYGLVALEKAVVGAKNFRWLRNKSRGILALTEQCWELDVFPVPYHQQTVMTTSLQLQRSPIEQPSWSLVSRFASVKWFWHENMMMSPLIFNVGTSCPPTHDYRGELSRHLLLPSPSWDPVLWFEEHLEDTFTPFPDVWHTHLHAHIECQYLSVSWVFGCSNVNTSEWICNKNPVRAVFLQKSVSLIFLSSICVLRSDRMESTACSSFSLPALYGKVRGQE